ncbi:hypothetical protein L9F63_010323, partial [Diploptera punctata]
EREYLRHVVARIANLQPDLVLVHRNVSRLAQEFLLALKVTLVLNVKANVLERVARCTQADIVTSVDAHIGRPQLGTCESFYLKTFRNDKGVSKTLMFFENNGSQRLGCSVLLRGAGINELAKLKRVISRIVFTEFSWRLEKSFLMDEFARPPSPPTDSFFEEPSQDDDPASLPSKPKLYESDLNIKHSFLPISGIDEDMKCSSNKTQPMKMGSKEKSLSEEKRMNVESVSDFSDPLHLYLNLEDEVFNAGNNQSTGSGQWLSVAELPLSNRFRKALDDSILSSSPYLKFTVPYLETEQGRNCALRKFFPEEIFSSAQFDTTGGTLSFQDGESKFKDVKLRPQHPFISAKLTEPVDSREIQTMVAHFRACGGRVDSRYENLRVGKIQTRGSITATDPSSAVKYNSWPDALDPNNHQRLTVLFCSYSHESQNAPAFCVNPWVVCMDFYGHNDIPLGNFLERYCFRPSYKCPSESCNTPMVQHVRRFVHDMGCVHIILKELEKQIPDTEGSGIVMWNWCSKCKMVSPVVPMSADTWALSFAKYLELRFHGGMYKRRGQEGTYCPHSLHHDHYQYFGLRNIVASFKYTNITLWEVSLPPPLIAMYYDPQQQSNVIEEIKLLALKGYEVYSCILEKLRTFGSDVEGIATLKQQLQKEQAHFKSCIEEIQLKLTSPTLEAKKLEDVQQLMWRIEDSVVQLKRLISDVVVNWNTKIQDLVLTSKKRDEKHRKSESGRPLPPATSHSLEYDRVSSNSSQYPDDVVESTGTSSQWDDTSSCSEGREDMSPSSPEPSSGFTSVLELISIINKLQNFSLEENGYEGTVMESAENIDADESLNSGPVNDVLETSSPGQPADANSSVTRSLPSGSPRGHVRSYSDVTPSMGEDVPDKRETQHMDKKSVKTILSHLLPTSTVMAPIQSPLSPQEHHLAPSGCSVPVVVYENEPSSIIAYALSSQEYQRSLDEILAKKSTNNEQATPSKLIKTNKTENVVDKKSGIY